MSFGGIFSAFGVILAAVGGICGFFLRGSIRGIGFRAAGGFGVPRRVNGVVLLLVGSFRLFVSRCYFKLVRGFRAEIVVLAGENNARRGVKVDGGEAQAQIASVLDAEIAVAVGIAVYPCFLKVGEILLAVNGKSEFFGDALCRRPVVVFAVEFLRGAARTELEIKGYPAFVSAEFSAAKAVGIIPDLVSKELIE